MQISIKCSVAVHCLIFIHEAKGIAKVTSNLLAQSTGSNPVVIRNHSQRVEKGRAYYGNPWNRWCGAVRRPVPDHLVPNLFRTRAEWFNFCHGDSSL